MDNNCQKNVRTRRVSNATMFTGQGFGPNSGFLILFFFDVGSVTPTRRLTDFNRPGEKKAVYRIDRCDWPRPLESTFISSSHTEISKQAPEKGFFCFVTSSQNTKWRSLSEARQLNICSHGHGSVPIVINSYLSFI